MSRVVTLIDARQVFSRDPTKRHPINLRWFGNAMSTGDAAIEYYPDGRLKSLNSSQTGQGATALQAIIKLAAVAGALKSTSDQIKSACEELGKIVDVGKPLTIKYFGSTNFKDKEGTVKPTHSFELEQITLQKGVYERIEPIVGSIAVAYQTPAVQLPVMPNAGSKRAAALPETCDSRDDRGLVLVQPAEVQVTIAMKLGGGEPVTSERVFQVPQLGAEYCLPLQRAPLFGESKLAVVLNESGSLQKLQYAGAGDVAGVFGTITELRSAADETTDEKIAQLKAESDLIAQQQRWVSCQADPVNCK